MTNFKSVQCTHPDGREEWYQAGMLHRVGDLMTATEVLARLRIEADSEDFEGAQLGPVAVRKLLKHIAALESDRWRQLCRIHSNRADALRRERDALAARLEAIERAEPVIQALNKES